MFPHLGTRLVFGEGLYRFGARKYRELLGLVGRKGEAAGSAEEVVVATEKFAG